MKRLAQVVGMAGVLLVAAAILIAVDRQRGEPEQAGEVTAAARDPQAVAARAARQDAARAALGMGRAKQILFGDVHAHTTFSMDAFAWSVPILGGEGLHPPADACDFARFVANLDFWALTDHAEALTPRHWRMTKQAVRDCNAAAGDPANPDLVTFLGWEWTQIGATPQSHYGHRNVVLLDTAEDAVPARPIAAGGIALNAMRNDPLDPFQKYIGPYLVDFEHRQRQVDQQHKQADLRATTLCPRGVSERELPADCVEFADTPAELFDKLDQWGFPVLTIPHGTTWGFYTPPGYDWSKQLTAAQHDPKYQRLIEIYSGHGNAEQYRDYRAVEYNADGKASCAAPTDGFMPCCHRAGEIIRARCDDPHSQACEAHVAEAEQNYVDAGIAGRLTVPGVEPADWQGCGQCPDCYQAPFKHRPGGSVQYILAHRNFKAAAGGKPERLRLGFIGSSDNHSARPGTGFKEIDRTEFTDTYGAQNALVQHEFFDAPEPPDDKRWSQPFDRASSPFNFLQITESERQASFFYTGGLVAVHSAGRDRDSIWQALNRREVYATSGVRILLWFDLLDDDGGTKPMGSIVRRTANPHFRVRAVGAFKQKPGCPESVVEAVGAERLDKLSGGECYNPSDTRNPIERIEVVRIRPQTAPGQPLDKLIDDPWRVFSCSGDSAGCTVEFSDPEFNAAGRETIYYVRALQTPTPTINGDQLRCSYDEQGRCVKVDPCYGDPRTPAGDDCLADRRERAWSSPLFIDYGQ